MSMRMGDPELGQYGASADLMESPTADTFSVIDRHSVFDGTFNTSRDLRVEGEVKGTIDCKGTLFVAEGATVGAKVEAENIAVAGDLNGDIHCRGRLQIMPSGRVRGKVNTQTLVINEGAYYEGQLEMTPPDERTGAAAPRNLSAINQPVAIGNRGAQSGGPQAAGGPQAGGGANGGSASTFIRRLGGPETPWSENRTDEGPEQDTDE